MKFVDQAAIIKGQNELLLLDLLIGYKQLKSGKVDRLMDDLPKLKELIGIIYQAAEHVDGMSSHNRGQTPVWSDVSCVIVEDYPDTRSKLATIEKKLSRLSPDDKPSSKLLKEIRRDLIPIINTVAGIHADILRIPLPRPPKKEESEDADTDDAIILDVNNLRLIRNQFKLPNS